MNDRRIAFRMADANWNRVMEGLRTLEDIARFQDLASFQSHYKTSRHALQLAIEDWDRTELLSSRDSDQDVGRTEKQAAELSRSGGILDIASSASGRCEQGLRVLEEIAKFLYPDSVRRFESLRYRIYDINAELQLALRRDLEFLNRALLYVLVDCRLPLTDFRQRIEEISHAGVDLIQIRDKNAEAATLIRYTDAAINTLNRDRTRVIVNDRVDVATCTHAWGCHIGQEDLPAPCARHQLRGTQILGVSTHDVEQVKKAIADGADYMGCGPTFPSGTKSFDSFAGISFLSRAASLLLESKGTTAAFAIGGIQPSNVSQVFASGFDRIAVSGCIWGSEKPDRVAAALKDALLANRSGRIE
jgi:thiamine-phosphate pyrophosphorylase